MLLLKLALVLLSPEKFANGLDLAVDPIEVDAIADPVLAWEFVNEAVASFWTPDPKTEPDDESKGDLDLHNCKKFTF